MSVAFLGFERAGAGTVVSRAFAQSPIRLVTPRNHGAAAWAYTATLGGGLVGGDRLRVEVSVGEAARAYVTTQGPTRVFKSAATSCSDLSATVARGATLFLLPDPVSCFAGSRYQQRTEVVLEPGASLALWDVLSAGRERWELAHYRSTLSIPPFIDETVLLDPAHGPLSRRLGRFGALATLLLAGPQFARLAAELRAQLDASSVVRGGALIECASAVRDGVLLRCAAISVEAAQARLRFWLRDLPALLGDDPWRRDASFAA